jgi:hypothetical protein
LAVVFTARTGERPSAHFVDRRLSGEVEHVDPSVAVRADGSATSVAHAGVMARQWRGFRARQRR